MSYVSSYTSIPYRPSYHISFIASFARPAVLLSTPSQVGLEPSRYYVGHSYRGVFSYFDKLDLWPVAFAGNLYDLLWVRDATQHSDDGRQMARNNTEHMDSSLYF